MSNCGPHSKTAICGDTMSCLDNYLLLFCECIMKAMPLGKAVITVNAKGKLKYLVSNFNSSISRQE